jgi:hypothetical protein
MATVERLRWLGVPDRVSLLLSEHDAICLEAVCIRDRLIDRLLFGRTVNHGN